MNDLTQTLLRDVLTAPPSEEADTRRRITALMEHMLALPAEQRASVDEGLTHLFAPGTYARTLFIPAGRVIVGKIHKHAHLNFIEQGKIAVFSKDGRKVYDAPQRFVSSPGTQRVVWAIMDTVWTTVHDNPTNTQDLAAIEAHVIAPSYELLEVAS
jgi:hypothetical protein